MRLNELIKNMYGFYIVYPLLIELYEEKGVEIEFLENTTFYISFDASQ